MQKDSITGRLIPISISVVYGQIISVPPFLAMDVDFTTSIYERQDAVVGIFKTFPNIC